MNEGEREGKEENGRGKRWRLKVVNVKGKGELGKR